MAQRHQSAAQVGLSLLLRATRQSKADHVRTWCCNGADVPSWTSGRKGSTVQKREKRKACSKTYAPSTECNLTPCASDSDFSTLAQVYDAGLFSAAHGYSTPSTLEREVLTTYSEKAIYFKVRHVYSLWRDLSSSSKTMWEYFLTNYTSSSQVLWIHRRHRILAPTYKSLERVPSTSGDLSSKYWDLKAMFLNLLQPFCTRKQATGSNIVTSGVLTGKSTSYSTFPRETSAAQDVIYWLMAPLLLCDTALPRRAQ